MAWNWGISIITFAFGLGIGFALAYLAIPRSGRIKDLERQLTESKTQFNAYRSSVNQHFEKTAALFEDMTDRYRAVYRHMAEGAQNLCQEGPAYLSLDLSRSNRLPESGHQQTAKPASNGPSADTEPAGEAASAQAGAQAPSASPSDTEDEHNFGEAPQVPRLDQTTPGSVSEIPARRSVASGSAR